jgi:hypothetical protein
VPEDKLATYESEMRTYRRAKARGDWDAALQSLDMAIQACPVDEALGELAGLRAEAVAHTQPQSRIKQMFFGGARA